MVPSSALETQSMAIAAHALTCFYVKYVTTLSPHTQTCAHAPVNTLKLRALLTFVIITASRLEMSLITAFIWDGKFLIRNVILKGLKGIGNLLCPNINLF